jgi:hypothetical protein
MKMKIELPGGLDDIKLHQFQELIGMGSNVTEEDLVSIILEMDRKSIRGLDNGIVAQLVAHINTILSKPNKQLIKTFKIGDTEFGFEPNLDKAAWGVIIDAETYLGDWDKMHLAMASLYRPITNKNKKGQYEIEKYEGSDKYGEKMRFTPVDVVQGVQVFFCNLLKDLGRALQNYMKRTEMETALAHHLGKDGEDITRLLRSLEDSMSELIKLQTFQYEKPLHTSHS